MGQLTKMTANETAYGVKSKFVVDSTKQKQYNDKLQTWMNKKWISSPDDVYENHAELYQKIVERYSNKNSRKAHLIALVNFLKLDGRVDDETLNRYSDESTELNKVVADEKKDNVPVTDVTFEDIERKRDELKGVDPMAFLLLSFLTLMPPLRTNDYLLPITINEEDTAEGNWLYRAGKAKYFIVLNEYKTAPTYGPQKIKVPKELGKLIDLSIKANPRADLFVDDKGKPFTQQKYRSVLKKAAGITQNQVRHIYASHFFDQRPTAKQIELLAKQMLTSSKELREVYDQVPSKEPVKKVKPPVPPRPQPPKIPGPSPAAIKAQAKPPAIPPSPAALKACVAREQAAKEKRAAYDASRRYERNRNQLIHRMERNPNSASQATLLKYGLNRQDFM